MRVKRARVFFALWPDDTVRASLAELARSAQAECGGRAMAPEKIHLTLIFIGSIERARVPALEALAQRMDARAFGLGVDILGYWRHNRIIWAGARECPRELAALAAVLHAELARAGIPGEDRPYVPHITLVRDALRAPAAKMSPAVTWHAREFALIESVPERAGVRYQVRGRWPLRAYNGPALMGTPNERC